MNDKIHTYIVKTEFEIEMYGDSIVIAKEIIKSNLIKSVVHDPDLILEFNIRKVITEL